VLLGDMVWFACASFSFACTLATCCHRLAQLHTKFVLDVLGLLRHHLQRLFALVFV
jgi:hypothetical protein